MSPLVGHDHDQRGNDVEGGDCNDQQQQQADHGLFHLHRAEQATLRVRPVIGAVTAAQLGDQRLGNLWRLVQILQRQTNARHRAFGQALHGGRIGDVDQRQRAVQLRTDLEHRRHVQPLHARGNATGSIARLGNDQGQLVAHLQAETPRGDIADDHAELAGLQIAQTALTDVIGQNRHPGLLGRIDAMNLDRLHQSTMRQHAFELGIGRGGLNLRIGHGLVGQRTPVGERLGAIEHGVRHHAENARAHFLLEAVHHRQHHDHRQHAKRQADHRSQRDEGDEVVTALGPRIAGADEQTQRAEHQSATSLPSCRLSTRSICRASCMS